jgi:hypothetical protein
MLNRVVIIGTNIKNYLFYSNFVHNFLVWKDHHFMNDIHIENSNFWECLQTNFEYQQGFYI